VGHPPTLVLAPDCAPPLGLSAAGGATREAGVEGIDAFTPFPVDELNDILSIRDDRIARLGFIGGVFGAIAAYAMQIATNLDYPLDIGGRPLVTLQGFALIGFELTVLCSVSFMVAGFFILSHLPRYHQPIFFVDRFERATRDGFFLFLPAADAGALGKRREMLEQLGAETIDEVPA
jgi:hypothetical protein